MMTVRRFFFAATLAAALSTQTMAIDLIEIARFDVDSTASDANPEFIGSNPGSVAWNGSQLYVSGFNNSGNAADVSIVEVTNATMTGLQTATYGSAFGTLPAVAFRGYSGLDIEGNSLAAAADTMGAPIPEGISAYALGGGAALWTKNQRGGSGVGFDPGFGGADSGVGHTSFGSGRRALQDTTTGADIYTSSDGMIINGTGTGTFWRDMDFAPNGDIWLREGNNLIQGVRSGGNALSATNLVVDETEADFTSFQTVAYLNGAAGGDAVIYNDRIDGATMAFVDIIRVVGASGTTLPLNLSTLAPISDGNGAYDFSWDSVSQTLAVSDFANRNVHIFQAVPEPTSIMLVFMAIAALFRRR